MNILAVVCPNGLGHYRRSVGILRRVVERIPTAKVTLACSEWQRARLSGELAPFRQWHDAVTYITDVTDPGVHWSLEVDGYRDGRLLAWEERFARLHLDRYDVVLSDNLTGVLAYRPDAVLAGSFLWSDVLALSRPHDPHAMTFVERERELLARHRPPMLCVGAFATPGVLTQTMAIECQPMCENAVDTARPIGAGRVRVALLGGATAAAEALLETVARQLAATEYEIAVSQHLMARFAFVPPHRLVAFRFTPADYEMCDVVIARPGMGTVQDALAAGRPLLCVYEPGHAEMLHTGRRVGELGAGLDLTGREAPSNLDVAAAVHELLSEASLARFVAAREALGTHGLDQAADWLAAFMCSRTSAGPADGWIRAV